MNPRYVVERHDDEDGTIQYEIWDHAPETYGVLCVLSDDLITDAKAKAEQVATAMNCYADLMESLESALATIRHTADKLRPYDHEMETTVITLDGEARRLRDAIAKATGSAA